MRQDGIHTATAADADILAGLHRRSSLVHADTRAILLGRPDLFGVSATALDAGWVRIVVRRNRIVAFGTLVPGDGGAELEDLFVEPDLMNRGLGRLLLRDLAVQARGRAIHRINVTGNPNALGFYTTMGFLVDRRVETEFGPGWRMHLDTDG